MASSSSSSSTSLHRRLRDLTDDDYSGDDLYDGVERGAGHHHHVPTSAGDGGYTDRDDSPSSYRSSFRPWRGRLSSLRDAAAPPGPAGAALPPSPSPSSSPTHSRGSSEKTLSDDGRQAPSSAPPQQQQQQLELPPHAAAVVAQPPPPPPPQPQREFICGECGKSYPTNQGLGGHKAGHRNKERAEATAAAAMAAGGAAPPQQDRGRKEGPHVCGNCGKEFERGVQLGGHQRAHYKGPPIKPARRNKRRCLTPPGGGVVAEDNVNVVAPPTPVIAPVPTPLVRSSEEETTPSPPAAANVRPVLLFGTDISTHTQVEPSSEQHDSHPASTPDRG